jgi:hypothetical protein
MNRVSRSLANGSRPLSFAGRKWDTSARDIRYDALLHVSPGDRCAPSQLAPQDAVSPGGAGQSACRPLYVPPSSAATGTDWQQPWRVGKLPFGSIHRSQLSGQPWLMFSERVGNAVVKVANSLPPCQLFVPICLRSGASVSGCKTVKLASCNAIHFRAACTLIWLTWDRRFKC